MFKTGDGCSMEYMGRQKRPLPLEPVTVAYRVVSVKNLRSWSDFSNTQSNKMCCCSAAGVQ